MDNLVIEHQHASLDSGVAIDQEIERVRAALREKTEQLQQVANTLAPQTKIEEAGEAVLAAMMALYALLLYRIDWQEERGECSATEAERQRQLFQDQYLHDDGVLRKKIFG
ncbi:MAG: hypothetical protein HYV32_03245 [Candidatus Kerfeldbacteria bacterium]|nr:hypothetical protein [Candidatus Kerfeldbacteria bacterium]